MKGSQSLPNLAFKCDLQEEEEENCPCCCQKGQRWPLDAIDDCEGGGLISEDMKAKRLLYSKHLLPTTSDSTCPSREGTEKDQMMMEVCQQSGLVEEEKDGGRPLFFAYFGAGLALSCLFYVNPSTLMSPEVNDIDNRKSTQTKANLHLALLYLAAALAGPIIAPNYDHVKRRLYASTSGCLAILVFMALSMVLAIFEIAMPFLYLALGPWLAMLQFGHFSFLSPNKKTRSSEEQEIVKCNATSSAAINISLESGLRAAKGWPPLFLGLLLNLILRYDDEKASALKTPEAKPIMDRSASVPENLLSPAKFSTLLCLIIIALVVSLLATIVVLVNVRDAEAVEAVNPSIKRGHQRSQPEVDKKRNRKCCYIITKLLRLYGKDTRLHMILPLAFFSGLFEAYMARDFLVGNTRIFLGLKGMSLVIAILGMARLLATWIISKAYRITSAHVTLGLVVLFQSALHLLQWLWIPSRDDPLMFYAIGFIWGVTSASWDFLIYDGAHEVNPGDWTRKVIVLGLHVYAGEAVMFGIDDDLAEDKARLLGLAAFFMVSVLLFWNSVSSNCHNGQAGRGGREILDGSLEHKNKKMADGRPRPHSQPRNLPTLVTSPA